jgi:FtsH-binding integral membrane protein
MYPVKGTIYKITTLTGSPALQGVELHKEFEMKLKGKHYFDIFWIVFFAGIMITSFGYRYKARLIPIVVTIPCLAFAICRFYMDLRGKEDEGMTGEDLLLKGIKDKVETTSDSFRQHEKQRIDPAEKRRRFIDIVLWVLIFLGLIFTVGFLYAIPIFTLAYMRIHKEKWVLSILCAGGLCLGVYLAFVVGTQSYLYEGLFIPLIRGVLQE